jgi:iron(III) transport system permease protein
MRLLERLTVLLLAALLALPMITVLASWFGWDAQSKALLEHMASTVLLETASTSLLLSVCVALGVAVVGTGTAVAVTLFDFAGRRFLTWGLLLPLAVPGYVVAYAYTDFLQFSGPLQTAIRAATGWEGRVFPEVRSLGGAVWVFVFALYPYVYLLVRSALMERANHLMEAARLLGAGLTRRIVRVALPLARPAMAAGVLLAVMETLADYGVGSYFGIQTFTTGIYKAWLSWDNRTAAAQLSTFLLVLVVVLMTVERRMQQRMRFAAKAAGSGSAHTTQSLRLSMRGTVLAWLVCGLPVLAGFVLPVVFMLRPLSADWASMPWADFLRWSRNSLLLALGTAVLACAVALLLAFLQRTRSHWAVQGVTQLVSLGYAVPGTVIVVGLLLPVGWLQASAPDLQVGYWLTATVAGLVWAYLVRFSAVGLQSVQSGYARIPVSLDDAAGTLGVRGAGLMARVHWPLLRRSVAVAGLLVLVDVMKELPATLVLRPFNTDTLAVMAYQFARDERLTEAALPSLALVLVGLVPVLLLSRTLERSNGR